MLRRWLVGPLKTRFLRPNLQPYRHSSNHASSPPTSPTPFTSKAPSSGTAPPKGKSRTPPKNLQLPPFPPLVESDLEEEFLRGRGPGGQVINKSSILVSLVHVPSGTRVKCQETRSRESNRLIARKRMQEKLDVLWNGVNSRQELKRERERSKKAAKKRKGIRKRKGGGEVLVEGEGEEGEGGEEAGQEVLSSNAEKSPGEK
ncbi:BQ2448_5684 [Microbotryum intermedium]|uniref:BQ2448_5684 protein n=1 Tax=Microbotryum intermedium TaxID=269621 RepID=A0A238F770_9BASI|nr:BQ2448_5684 [Microbotryum intermedium]